MLLGCGPSGHFGHAQGVRYPGSTDQVGVKQSPTRSAHSTTRWHAWGVTAWGVASRRHRDGQGSWSRYAHKVSWNSWSVDQASEQNVASCGCLLRPRPSRPMSGDAPANEPSFARFPTNEHKLLYIFWTSIDAYIYVVFRQKYRTDTLLGASPWQGVFGGDVVGVCCKPKIICVFVAILDISCQLNTITRTLLQVLKKKSKVLIFWKYLTAFKIKLEQQKTTLGANDIDVATFSNVMLAAPIWLRMNGYRETFII
jgi:hypothetical protein